MKKVNFVVTVLLVSCSIVCSNNFRQKGRDEKLAWAQEESFYADLEYKEPKAPKFKFNNIKSAIWQKSLLATIRSGSSMPEPDTLSLATSQKEEYWEIRSAGSSTFYDSDFELDSNDVFDEKTAGPKQICWDSDSDEG